MYKRLLAFLGIAVFLQTYSMCQASLPTTEFKVDFVDDKAVEVQPFFTPQFRLLSEGRVPSKNDILKCVPKSKKIGSANGKNFVATELDCGDEGKFLVIEVDFARTGN